MLICELLITTTSCRKKVYWWQLFTFEVEKVAITHHQKNFARNITLVHICMEFILAAFLFECDCTIHRQLSFKLLFQKRSQTSWISEFRMDTKRTRPYRSDLRCSVRSTLNQAISCSFIIIVCIVGCCWSKLVYSHNKSCEKWNSDGTANDVKV